LILAQRYLKGRIKSQAPNTKQIPDIKHQISNAFQSCPERTTDSSPPINWRVKGCGAHKSKSQRDELKMQDFNPVDLAY
jgi:hypothetical protein